MAFVCMVLDTRSCIRHHRSVPSRQAWWLHSAPRRSAGIAPGCSRTQTSCAMFLLRVASSFAVVGRHYGPSCQEKSCRPRRASRRTGREGHGSILLSLSAPCLPGSGWRLRRVRVSRLRGTPAVVRIYTGNLGPSLTDRKSEEIDLGFCSCSWLGYTPRQTKNTRLKEGEEVER